MYAEGGRTLGHAHPCVWVGVPAMASWLVRLCSRDPPIVEISTNLFIQPLQIMRNRR